MIHPALYQVKEDNIIILSVEPPSNYITAEEGIGAAGWGEIKLQDEIFKAT